MLSPLENYLVETFNSNARPVILRDGGIYIWNAEQTSILAGPFDSACQAFDARTKALDKAIKVINRRA